MLLGQADTHLLVQEDYPPLAQTLFASSMQHERNMILEQANQLLLKQREDFLPGPGENAAPQKCDCC